MLLLLVGLGIGLAWWGLRRGGADRAPRYFELSGETMGTSYAVKVQAEDQAQAERLRALVQAQLDEVDDGMSTYRVDSELSRLNRAGAGEHTVSEALATVLALAHQVWEGTDGAFDPTVGPLVDAWGFGPLDVEASPSQAEIDALREHVGFGRLVLTARTVHKPEPALQLDLSAVAKGYAVDRAALALDGAGAGHYMVEVGGEVRTRGEGPTGAWRIGIEAPAEQAGDGRAIQRVLALDGRAMATSGDYRNYREEGGARLSHSIDPRTGRPIAHHLASVSVVHDSCALADAWATGLNVLGPDRGPEVAKQHQLAAYFIIREGEGFRIAATPAFEALESPP